MTFDAINFSDSDGDQFVFTRFSDGSATASIEGSTIDKPILLTVELGAHQATNLVNFLTSPPPSEPVDKTWVPTVGQHFRICRKGKTSNVNGPVVAAGTDYAITRLFDGSPMLWHVSGEDAWFVPAEVAS